MRTNIELDEALIREAMEITGLSTKKATVEEALRWIIRNHERKQSLDRLFGIGWDGDLDEMRKGWSPGETA